MSYQIMPTPPEGETQMTESTPPPPPPVTGTVLPADYVPLAAERRGCSGCAWGIGGALGCLALLLLPIVVLLLAGTVTLNGLIGSAQSIFSPRPAVASVVSTQTILVGIQPMGQLVSVSTQLAKADVFVGVQQGALNACGFSANHVAQGTVQAGIDFSRITETNISYNDAANTYTISVPPAQLTSCRVDFIRQYERSVTACNVNWDDASQLARYQVMSEFRDDALEGGVLRRAEDETRVALSSFVRALTGANVEITFQQADGPAPLDPSCQPSPPQGWNFDTQTNAWLKVG